MKCYLLERLHAAELKEDAKTPSPKRKTSCNTQINSSGSNTGTLHHCLPVPGSTPLSSKENCSPIKHLLNSPLKHGKCSVELFEEEK